MSTKIQINCCPIAISNNFATTDESTPPDKPNNTLSRPTSFFISAILFRENSFIVHDDGHLQMLLQNLSKIFFPCVV